MDPDATLAQIRRLLREGDLEGASQSFHYLDGWMSSQGFLPKDWARGRR